MNIIVRYLPDDVVAAIDALAASRGQTRQTFLAEHLTRIAEGARQEMGRGIKGFTPQGGRVLIQECQISNAVGLTGEQELAFERARLLADPRNGSQWDKARQALESVGMDVFNT